MPRLSRRRFLTIAAASAALPAGAGSTGATAMWNGVALGAGASMRIAGMTQAQAAPIFAAVETELVRLERVFSLYRADSELARLNALGRLDAPSPDLLDVLDLSARLHKASEGTFDPTVQPLWQVLAHQGDAGQIAAARAMIGFERLSFGPSGVWFGDGAGFEGKSAQPRPALTLNGIAQGAITDRVAALLRARGLRDVLIDMGELAALGRRGDGRPWQVGVADPEGKLLRRLSLSNRAVATSASHGTMLNPATGQGHILNPRGAPAPDRRIVSVSAPRAALADGLSTALCLLPDERIAAFLAQFPGARREFSQG